MEKIKVKIDRAYRCYAVMTNPDKLTARLVSVPQGGPWNAEDIVELHWATKKKNASVPVKVKDEHGRETGEEVVALQEVDTGERDGDPEPVRLVARKYERRSYVKWKGDGAPLVKELQRKGWPFEQLEGGCAVIAHPKATKIGDTAKVVGVKLLEESLELQEPEPD